MKVTYNAPNRSHHYRHAEALHRAGVLRRFVSGYPRLGRDPEPDALRGMISRVDAMQTAYVIALRLRLFRRLTEWLSWRSKQQIDAHSLRWARESDAFLFYSGCGLQTMRRLRAEGEGRCMFIVEAVNTHAAFQEAILREEHKRLELPFRPFPHYEMHARLQEYREADAILCPSEAVKRSFVEEGISADNVHIVPYGFQVTQTRAPRHRRSDTFIVLYVGSLDIRKGIRYLIGGFNTVRHPRKRLVLVGPRSRVTGFENVAVSSDIEFRGILKGSELQRAYDEATVFVQPSLEEGLSLVLGEALAAGLPIIATDRTGVEELFADGSCGYHIPCASADAIATALQRLADNPALITVFGSAASERAKVLGGWERSGEHLVRTLDTLVRRHRQIS